MKSANFQFKKLHIPKSVGLPLESFNFIWLSITLISLFEKLRFYFFDVALTPGLIQKVIANVFSSARIKKIFV